jgi:hypothetical protein
MQLRGEFPSCFEALFAANHASPSIANGQARIAGNRCEALKHHFLLRYNHGLIPHYSFFKPVLEGLP